MAASLRVPRKLCSFLFFYVLFLTLVPQVILGFITYSREELLNIRSASTHHQYDQEYVFRNADPVFCLTNRTTERIACSEKNDSEKEGNEAVFWSDSGDGHTVHHSLAFFLPMSSLLTTRLTKSEQGWHSRGTSETATFSASWKHGLLGRRYPMRCSQRVSPRIAPTETNIFLVRRVAGAYAS